MDPHDIHTRTSIHALYFDSTQEDFERQKLQLTKESERNRTGSDRFVAKTETVEEILKNKTIGLKTLSDFQETRAELEEQKRREAAKTAELK